LQRGGGLSGTFTKRPLEDRPKPLGNVKLLGFRFEWTSDLVRRDGVWGVTNSAEQIDRVLAPRPQSAQHQASPRPCTADRSIRPKMPKRVKDMVADRRPVFRSRKTAAPRPARQRFLGGGSAQKIV